MGGRICELGLICIGLLVFKGHLQEVLAEIPKEKALVVGKNFVTSWGAGRSPPLGTAEPGRAGAGMTQL